MKSILRTIIVCGIIQVGLIGYSDVYYGIEIDNKTMDSIYYIDQIEPLVPDTPYFFDEIYEGIGLDQFISLEQKNPGLVVIKEGSLMKIDYKSDLGEHVVELFYPETIYLAPYTVVPLSYNTSFGPGMIIKNMQVTIAEGKTGNLGLHPDYKGPVIISGENGATLKRNKNENGTFTLVEGFAYKGMVESDSGAENWNLYK